MDEAREDDGRLDGLYNRPGYMMRRCVQTFTGVFHETCAELGLTIRQYDFLYVLDAYETVDQDHLARALGLDRSTTGLVVAILERKRLIERQVKPSDRRKRSLTITPAGRKMFKAAEAAARAGADSILVPLDPAERDQLLFLLRRILDAREETKKA